MILILDDVKFISHAAPSPAATLSAHVRALITMNRSGTTDAIEAISAIEIYRCMGMLQTYKRKGFGSYHAKQSCPQIDLSITSI